MGRPPGRRRRPDLSGALASGYRRGRPWAADRGPRAPRRFPGGAPRGRRRPLASAARHRRLRWPRPGSACRTGRIRHGDRRPRRGYPRRPGTDHRQPSRQRPARRPPATTITLATTRTSQDVKLYVIDQGPGMSETERRRPFERFWRASDTHHDGTGPGLPIVERLTRASGGRITLDPAPGSGLDAVVRLQHATTSTPAHPAVPAFPPTLPNADNTRTRVL
ncbi:sensor histidine kinase [Streptomyces massasporeus]|uniref:ATP-binding protein n=1 Tax=Streptomyces massasporeus TaxID=67324 RepID=UPI0036C69A04